MKSIYFLLVSLVIISCNDDELEIVNMRINHHMQSAVGVAPTLVLMTQEDDKIGTNDWQYHYAGISGFNYVWGYVYDLKISKRHFENPLADGSSFEYILEKLISKTPVDKNTSFELNLKSESRGITPTIVTGDAGSGFKLMNEEEINCSTYCEELEQFLDEENEVTGSFRYDNLNQLLLLKVKSE